MSEVTTKNNLESTVIEMNNVVFKGFLNEIDQYPLVQLNDSLEQTIHSIRIRKIAQITYDRNEDILVKLNSIFAAMHSSDSCLSFIIQGHYNGHTDLYLATYKDKNGGHDAMETLQAALKGNFPGINVENNLDVNQISSLLKPIQANNHQIIASVAGVPSLKNDDKKAFSQGLEKIIEGMQGRKYTAVIHATPIEHNELMRIEHAYQDLYSTLSVFEQTQLTLSENDSAALSKSISEGVTNTLTKTIGETQTNTEGSSQSLSSSKSDTQSSFDFKRALSQAAGGAVSGGVAAGAVSGGLGAAPGALIGGIAGFTVGLFGGSKTTSNSETNATNNSFSFASSNTNSESEAFNRNTTDSTTKTTGTGKSLQITEKNRRVTGLLSILDEQIERLKTCKNYGMWQWGAYFLAESELDAKLGADLYSGILCGEATGLERNHIAIWRRYQNEFLFNDIQGYLSQLKHPVFNTPAKTDSQTVTHTALISTQEMTVAMNLPQKSLPGIPVIDAVTFGRSVTSLQSSFSESTIDIGNITNLGTVELNNKVLLDVNSLTSHTFVTGSTGAGKSNTVYSLISKLYQDKKIPFLIIEPAKGEYKNVFGGMEEVSVFGTNPKLTPLLKINPFSFPESIHVIEHIDRLIEILNAVWPMYAAMPAILKQAIEATYQSLGWDLLNSESCHSPAIYPDFYDLLNILPSIIEQSDYSQEIKGNYAGALITRIQSLTNGYFKTIFQKEELSLDIIFDKPCIVDLSRVGSSETKSLLMGILFLKLQSYRMANSTQGNSNLKHITVLEEAHNLLRKTSDVQSAESGNVQGKSVEMIANAIAEMRTYGEGFIISDQAPGLMDSSVIRNTNTKIILRLPDFSDRELVGKSAHLNEDQIEDLARLKTGCAAVYQNNWLEPVLCQFDYFDEKNSHVFKFEQTEKVVDARKKTRSRVLKQLVTCVLNHDDECPIEGTLARNSYFPCFTYRGRNELNSLIGEILEFKQLIKKIKYIESPLKWVKALYNEIKNEIFVHDFSDNDVKALLGILLELSFSERPENRTIIEKSLEMMEQNQLL